MRSLRFSDYLEATDIFGFERERAKPERDDRDTAESPIKCFSLELMMEFLAHKKVGQFKPTLNFINEIQWGDRVGAVKLYIDTGLTFYVKKLGTDKNGEHRWITKKMFQLNRNGYGGLEDAVAGEIHEHLSKAYQKNVEAPKDDYDDLEHLVTHISRVIKRTAKDIFMYEGIKKMSENNYMIILGVRGGGVEAPDHRRVEENITQVTYDKESGTIRLTNYNVESPTGGPHSWTIQPNDLDIMVFPTQDREEIGELVGVHMRYY